MVLLSLFQQVQQCLASAQTRVEELNFFIEWGRLQVIAEIAAVQRVLERTHRIFRRVGEYRERGGAQQDQAS